MANIFQELPTLFSGNAAAELDKIKQSIQVETHLSVWTTEPTESRCLAQLLP